MKIKYVGVKQDGETAFASLSGIERWMPGDSFEVKDGVATRMLQHPDVFALADSAAVPQAKTAAPQITLAPAAPQSAPTTDDNAVDPAALSLSPGAVVENPAPVSITLADGTVKVLDGLDKPALYELTKELGLKVHPALGPAKLIAALQEAFPAKAP
ncbi:MAG: hypothetical protein U5L73_11300 [Rhodoferax sp.]|uniref:hypothetical protein n=1 Tax=Rhodoferax sp. TaxID=50421 RepID=UPI002ACD876D|nr:hypothetical protein [Rhodoferax sp.]MDZ7892328.1 hypothetical protein [Rhodoferax sp.]